MGIIKPLSKVLNGIDTINIWVGKAVSWTIVVLVLTVAYEVVARYLFNSPTDWSYRLSLFLFGGSLLMGGWSLIEKKHVTIDIITKFLSPRWQAIFDVILYLIIFMPFIVVMVWKGYDQAAFSWKMNQIDYESNWHVPLAPFKTVIPVAAGLLLLQGIAHWIRQLYFAITGESWPKNT